MKRLGKAMKIVISDIRNPIYLNYPRTEPRIIKVNGGVEESSILTPFLAELAAEKA